MAFTGSGFFFGPDSRFARACGPGARMIHRIYFAPGMFGFGRLGSYDYFAHVERAITERLRAVGHDAYTYVLDVPPTASIRRRAAALGWHGAFSRAGWGSGHLQRPGGDPGRDLRGRPPEPGLGQQQADRGGRRAAIRRGATRAAQGRARRLPGKPPGSGRHRRPLGGRAASECAPGPLSRSHRPGRPVRLRAQGPVRDRPGDAQRLADRQPGRLSRAARLGGTAVVAPAGPGLAGARGPATAGDRHGAVAAADRDPAR